ncbi:hypothetical protein KH5H1_66630 [Corallococcus caeni]|uniref:DUF3996 domain-containing protein n=1 Tax=Corallococcus exercitus TaxID=2316736 RepID=A0A7Y4KIY7_9BACT|nr:MULTISPECIES: hypothetical protein [Corallococcus]GMU02543.1 hypothetical protein KH5H1_66630 [Corallococcus sp. KH5-1]MBN9681307.1 hypothetical protein [Corallococcus sp. NCSPR001]NOK12704.1 hypothetical protein [Corallococcus exercitus]NOK34668.1 hypothetical protein [Corallococcus exercitus]WAS87112.1 hypothetical protein O0N60_09080 [Corallococcus sp. NCRR]
MHLLRIYAAGLFALGLLLVPAESKAQQSGVRLGVGADYWVDTSAAFNFTLGVEGHVAGPLFVGARFGAVLVTDGNIIGVPLDISLRATVGRTVYIEGLAGPWIFFKGDTFKAHAAFGFGLQGKAASIGVEVGYLDPNPIIGLRLGYKF